MTSKTPDAAGEIFLALGANVPGSAGPPLASLKAALSVLENRGVVVARISSFYETEAWPDPGDPPFINAVAAIQTDLQPLALLTLLHEVETSLGRKRSSPNAPRALDLDLLDYRGRVERGAVILPHPRLEQRRFVLEPLAQVAPLWRHPLSGHTAMELLAALS